MFNGKDASSMFSLNGREYQQVFYLTYGIYPGYQVFIKAFTNMRLLKQKSFRDFKKPLERTLNELFGVLKKSYHIIARPAPYARRRQLHDIIKTVIILHNMRIEDERHMQIRYNCICAERFYDNEEAITLERGDDEYNDHTVNQIFNHHVEETGDENMQMILTISATLSRIVGKFLIINCIGNCLMT